LDIASKTGPIGNLDDDTFPEWISVVTLP